MGVLLIGDKVVAPILTNKPKVEKDINFYDFDGTLVESYSLAQFASVTELPEAPDHTSDAVPLVFDEWNWTIDEIKALQRPCNIGASYHTADGNTHMIIDCDEPVHFSMAMRASNAVNTTTANWGDGVVETLPLKTSYSIVEHDYLPGLYHVIISSDRTISFGGANTARPVLSEIYFPSDCINYYGYALSAAGVTKMTLPATGRTFAYNFMPYNQLLRCLVLPRGCTDYASSFFQNCGMEILCLPGNLTTLASNLNPSNKLRRLSLPDTLTAITACGVPSLREITFPPLLDTIPATTLSHSLESITILGMGTKLASGALANHYSLREINIPQGWVLNTNVDLGTSLNFTREAVIDFLRNLGRGTATITLAAVTFGMLSADDKAIATSKGYTIASA